jgi:hypothetical protein
MGNTVVVEALLESAITPNRLISKNEKYDTFADSTLASLLVGGNGFMRFDNGDIRLLRWLSEHGFEASPYADGATRR